MQSVFFNKGENCIAAGRIFVEDNIYDEFLRRVIHETKKIQIGDPLNKSTSHGPQNHLAHMKKLLEYVEIGKYLNLKLKIHISFLFQNEKSQFVSTLLTYFNVICFQANKVNISFEHSVIVFKNMLKTPS